MATVLPVYDYDGKKQVFMFGLNRRVFTDFSLFSCYCSASWISATVRCLSSYQVDVENRMSTPLKEQSAHRQAAATAGNTDTSVALGLTIANTVPGLFLVPAFVTNLMAREIQAPMVRRIFRKRKNCTV
jgi:hypothetical protein